MKFVEPQALRAVMDERDHSCRTVAQLCRALADASPGRYKTVSYGLVSALMTGKVTAIHDLRAAAIERALSVPAGSLFAEHGVTRQIATGQDAA